MFFWLRFSCCLFITILANTAEQSDDVGDTLLQMNIVSRKTMRLESSSANSISSSFCDLHRKGPCTNRIAWFHPMNTATSFGTALAHFANSTLPQDAHIPYCDNASADTENHCPGGEQGDVEFFQNKYPVNVWFRNVFWHPTSPGNHKSISNEAWATWKHNFVGLFRQPEARVQSSFKHFREGKGDLQKYARWVRGNVVKLMSGKGGNDPILCEFYSYNCPRNESERCPSCTFSAKPYVRLAVHRLRQFRFVGITEHFDLSVCLFHAMFGGECRKVEFFNMRPGAPPQSRFEKLLAQDPDPYDGALYSEALRIFWSNVKKYDVRRSTCKKICPDVPHIFQSVNDTSLALPQFPGATMSGGTDHEYDWPGRHFLLEA